MTILHHISTGRGAKCLIKCDACGATYERLCSIAKQSKLHFCDMRCKSKYGWIRGYTDHEYRKDRTAERKDAKNKKKDEVKKRCMACGHIYYGPPGAFPKDRDPEKPEPGLCPVCSQRIPYDEGETAGVVMI